MTSKSLIWSLLGTVILAGAASAQDSKGAGTMSEIQALEQTWLKSEQTNNADLLTALLADNIVDTTTDGKLITGKDAVIADAKSVKWSHAEYTEMQIAVYTDTAIATAVFTAKGTDSGKAVDVHERFTDTWVRTSAGQWRCVATHGSLITN